ncbi:MAG: carbohydrate ABC transporter permease [bacterium]|nr:carbohydrate ABC transporter permease [bacterium]
MTQLRSTKLRSAALVLVSVIYLIPLYVAITNAFKSYENILKNPLGLPLNFTLENFQIAFQRAKILSLYVNSGLITSISLLLLIMISSMLGFIFARKQSKFYQFLYIFVLAGMMVPPQLVLIPSIKTLKYLHLLGTLPGLIFFYGGTYLSIGVFMYTEFLKTVPKSLEEAAYIDGANQFQVFFKVVLPLVKPCTATVTIFLGMWIWNDFLPPMYILGSQRGRTITTGIYAAIGRFSTYWNIVFACVILASIPILIVFLLLRKQFISGLTAGAIKG